MHSPAQLDSARRFIDAPIDGVIIEPLRMHGDSRGWLMELYREDQIEQGPPAAMAYASMTLPGIFRGPHEHRRQTDRFCFFGPSDFLVVLWDNRPASATFNHRMKFTLGASSPGLVVIPSGVVHGYRNVGMENGVMLNLPDRLYMGPERREDVDEIRHELDPHSPFNPDD